MDVFGIGHGVGVHVRQQRSLGLNVRAGMAHAVAVRDHRKHFKIILGIPDDGNLIQSNTGQCRDLGNTGAFVSAIL